MITFLMLAVVVGTLILAGRQGENEIGKVIMIIAYGFALFSLLAELNG